MPHHARFVRLARRMPGTPPTEEMLQWPRRGQTSAPRTRSALYRLRVEPTLLVDGATVRRKLSFVLVAGLAEERPNQPSMQVQRFVVSVAMVSSNMDTK